MKKLLPTLAVLTSAALLVSCSGESASDAASTTSAAGSATQSAGSSAASSSAAASAANGEAGTVVENCGQTYTFAAPPQRVMLQDASPVAALAELGLLDRVVARAGLFEKDYFPDEVNAQIDKIPSLSERLDGTGHLQITKEAVIAQNPDVIFGRSEAVNSQTTPEVPVIVEPGFCGEVKNASWEHVHDQIDLYAKIFSAPENAAAAKQKFDEQVAKLDSNAGKGRTVAVVYPGVAGGPFYAYGADSMSNPVVTSLGLKNVFGDVKERVFEISAEQLVAKNPDIILILHANEPDVEGTVKALPQADTITAVKEGQLFPLALTFVEPATPLSVVGAQKLEAFLKS